MKNKISSFLLASVGLAGLSTMALAQGDGVYWLGQIHVSAPNNDSIVSFDDFGGSVITNEQTQKNDKTSLDKALNSAPGVVASNSGGSRNEQLIFVHGFDRWQVPLSLDGVRIYLPADNRLDFGRFLTPDISEIQIAKSYVSVLDGSGGMGGAINLVTKKPTKSVEAELQQTIEGGRDAEYTGFKTYGRVGMKQDNFYLQASGTWVNSDGWDLPASFVPTANENGGRRDHSNTKDWSANAKLGYTPNATDEYSINFTRQEGAKGAPYHVNDPIASQRYWDWPVWDVQTLSFLSNTKLGDSNYVKTKAYWSTFYNILSSYDNAAQTIQSLPKAFNSTYDDYALGADLEVGHDFGNVDTLKAAAHVRKDSHTEWNDNFRNASGGTGGCTVNVVCFSEPKQLSVEDTYNIALENTWHVTPSVDLVQGVGYDIHHLIQAQDFASNAYVNYPLADSSAWNAQAAAIYHYSKDGKVYANVSDRTRFPTLFERFSSRFGGATSNPNLKPERAVNYQLGWTQAFGPKSQVSGDVYYADVSDIIQSVPIVYLGNPVTQSQNVGSGHYYGADFAVDFSVSDFLSLGGNVSYMHREVNNPTNPAFQLTGVPEFKGTVYATFNPVEKLSITPSVDLASDRWTVNTAGTNFYKTGAYTLFNLVAEYQFNDHFSATAGVSNIFDTLYVTADGFPDPGRSYFVTVKTQF